jgi:hypothetical protein
MTRDEYEAIDALNWSKLKLMEIAPVVFQRGSAGDFDAADLGTAAHMAILEPEKFAAEVVVAPMRRDARTKAWQEFEAEHLQLGHLILTKSEHAEACAMRDAVHRNKRAMYYLTGGQSEVPMVWNIGPVKCKGRADHIGPAIVDLKTTKDASPRAFGSAVAKLSYDGQAAWYRDGWRMSTQESLPFVFIALEKGAPHIVQVYTVPDHVLERGREKYLNLLGKLDYCQRTGWWGGYSEEDEMDIVLPEWVH